MKNYISEIKVWPAVHSVRGPVANGSAESPVQLDIKCNEDFTNASHARTEMQLLRSKSINAIYWTALIAVYLDL